MKKILIRLLMRLLDSSFVVDYTKIDKQAVEDWAYRSYGDKGWQSYFAYTDLKILKTIGQGQEGMNYWINVGRRIQLILLLDEMKKAVQNKQSRQEKQEVKNAKA